MKMPIFIIDEDMPRSTGTALAECGYVALDIRDHGLRGADDSAIFAFAQSHKAIIITQDLGFANILQYPPASHFGIVVARFPNSISSDELNRQICACVQEFEENDLRHKLVLVEPGRVRIRS